jgi:diacylglycerol kinase (ATP)
MRLLIFHNQSAGSGDTTREELLDAFAEAGFDATYSTKREGEPADASGTDTIVVAGGDGTVQTAIDRFTDFRGSFTILPLGGANNIATSIGIHGGPNDVAGGLRQGRRRGFCLGRLEGCGLGREFVESVGVGALAGSLAHGHAHTPKGDKIRAGRTTLADMLREAEPIRSKITVEGTDLPGDALFAEVLNVGVTGPSLRLAPNFEAGVGTLAVAWLPAEKREAFITALLGDAPLPHEIVRGAHVDVAWRADPLRIDDDIPEGSREGRLHVQSANRSVEIIVPAEPHGGREQ